MMNPERIAEMKENPKAPYYIVYEDNEILVVYKKRDVFTIATPDPKTFHHNLFYYLQVYASESHETVYLVHRLDFETSGLVVFAKTAEKQSALKAAFEARQVGRYYEAVVKESLPQGKTYDVDQYLEEGQTVRLSDPEHEELELSSVCGFFLGHLAAGHRVFDFVLVIKKDQKSFSCHRKAYRSHSAREIKIHCKKPLE